METLTAAQNAVRPAHQRPLTLLAVTVGLLSILGCGTAGLYPKDEIMEMSNPEFKGPQFRTLGLIAGDDSQGTIAMTGRIRKKLKKAGLTVLRTPGRWEGEADALGAICSKRNPEPDGVVFVRWDRINLRACHGEGYPQAYEAEGEYVGVGKLANRLLAYLKIPRDDNAGDEQD